MSKAGNNLPLDVKITLVGPSDSGKTAFIKFLKGVNFEYPN